MALEFDLPRRARRAARAAQLSGANWVLPTEGPDGRAARRARRRRRHVRPDRDLRAAARGRAQPALHRPRARGREGPWTTFARMDILRSPKHLTGPDLGSASLTYRAWHEAKFGARALAAAAQDRPRLEWARVPSVGARDGRIPGGERDRSGFARSSPRRRVCHVEERKASMRERSCSRMGREGSGALRWPTFASFDPGKARRQRVSTRPTTSTWRR